MEGNYAARNKHQEDHDSFGFEKHTWGTCSWPARNYSCSFCKKEFRSAQALGGHMNVHRRDRARLRTSLITSSTSLLSDSAKLPNPTIKPNNNPNSHLSSPSSPISSYLSADAHNNNNNNNNNNRSPLYSPCLTLSSYSSLSPPSASTSGDKKPRLASQVPLLSPQSREIKMICNTRSGLGVEGLKGCAVEDENKVFKNNYEHKITLELGIGLLKHPNDKLDLELRLGH